MKQDLIHQAQLLSNSNDWKKTTDGMNDLMNKWKACGTAGKDSDDALWEEFNAARQTFFDRKRKHWEDMKSQFANALTAKEDLIVQAAALSDSEEWQKTSEKFKELMDQWKAAGSAGKEHEDRLWNEFNENRQKFYERRNAHYDKLHEEQNRHYEAKKALVEQAKAVVTAQAFNRSNTELMKKLGVDWKTIGSCGKEKEDKIWNEFRSTMDDYFNGLKEWNQQKHENWRQRMLDIRSRKQDMIQNQNRQIRRMEQEIVGLLGEKAIADMNEAIEDKKEFIKELEAEIADIDKTLAE